MTQNARTQTVSKLAVSPGFSVARPKPETQRVNSRELLAAHQAQVAPWWQVQPDFKYFWIPGGGVANSS
jgi:hypothetical protein